MVKEVFKVQKLGLDKLVVGIQAFGVDLLVGFSLGVIPRQEFVESFDSGQLEHSRELEHENLLV